MTLELEKDPAAGTTVEIGRSSHLAWELVRDGSRCTVLLDGELDIASCDALEQTLATSLGAESVVVFDLHGVTFVDSTGLRLFLRWSANVGDWGGELKFARVSEPARRLFDVTGLTTRLSYVGA